MQMNKGLIKHFSINTSSRKNEYCRLMKVFISLETFCIIFMQGLWHINDSALIETLHYSKKKKKCKPKYVLVIICRHYFLLRRTLSFSGSTPDRLLLPCEASAGSKQVHKGNTNKTVYI